MRQEAAALALDIGEVRQEFGNGLRARLEVVRVQAEPEPVFRRDISPELMLVSPEGARITGQAISVDGGYRL